MGGLASVWAGAARLLRAGGVWLAADNGGVTQPSPIALPLLGVDFTSAPSRRKPITVAHGALAGAVLRLDHLGELGDFASFESMLNAAGPWLGAFDFPFGLPRAFVEDLGLGASADAVINALRQRCATRMDFRALVDAWGNGRPVGQRLPHRRTDLALSGTRSTSPLQTRYVPVGFMYFEGLSRLVAAGLTLPGLRQGDPGRVGVEAYPGLLAVELIGTRSYKNSGAADRLIARKDIVDALEQGRSRLGLRLKLTHAQRERLVDDPLGDRLDAVLCLVQAAWASGRTDFGKPPDGDPLEGWIVTG